MLSKEVINQVTAGLTAAITTFYIGMAYAWISPNINMWLGPNTNIPMTVDQSSWITSIIAIGTVAATIPSGFLVDVLGRKTMLLAASPFMIVSWIIVIFTRSVVWLYVVRFLQGISMGSVFVALTPYLAEISSVKLRTFQGSLFIFSYNLGILVEYIIGNFLSYEILSYVNLLAPIIFIVLFFNKPETPYFLVARKRDEEASKSLKWLRGNVPSTAIDEELRDIISSVNNSTKSSGGYKDIFSSYVNRKAILIILTVVFVQNFCGNSAILALASYVFESAGQTFLSPGELSIAIGVVQISAVFFAAPLAERFGEKFLLIWTILICGVSQAGVAAYFFVRSSSADVSSFTWLPSVLIAIYFFFNAVGTGSLGSVIQGELLPTDLRGLGATLACLMGLGSGFASLRLYQLLAETAGIYLNHVLYTVGCVIGFIILIIFMPETKGLTFDEIRDRLSKRK